MSCNCSGKATDTGRVDFQYAVKIVFGPMIAGGPLPRGHWWTKVNIHNFSRCDCVTFQWKVAIGEPHLKIGPISDFAEATLCADEALEIDYVDMIRRLGGNSEEHIEGWVVIESPAELDVVAVYGSAASTGGAVNAFHTEWVAGRCLPVCDDFDLDPSTGVSRWDVAGPFPGQAPAGSTFTQATLGSLGNWPNMPGALWIHPPGGDDQPEGVYTYRLTFKLCSGFRNPRLEGSFFADYFAGAYLNGHPVSVASPGPNYPTPISVTATSHFKAGENELIILVTNSEKGTTGLAFHGNIEVERGLCAGEPMPLLPCPGINYRVYTRHFWFHLGSWHDGDDWWGPWVSDGAEAGTTGQGRRIEALEMTLSNASPGTQLEYRVWYHTLTGVHLDPPTLWAPAGTIVGTTGQKHPIVSVEIRLVNPPLNGHVAYRVHRRKGLTSGGTGGWQPPPPNWVYDGTEAGAHNYFPYYRLEQISG